MIDSSARFKPIQSRRLTGGTWVIVADGSEPLIVPEWVVHALEPGAIPADSPDVEALLDTMVEAGFVAVHPETEVRPLPSPPMSSTWWVVRGLLWGVGLFAAVAAAFMLIQQGIPTGADLMSIDSHPIFVLLWAMVIALATAVPHELAHIVFGKTLGQQRGSLRVDRLRAVATTNITHVWAWPLSSRLAAVSAGLVIDLVCLVIALAAREAMASGIATIAVVVLIIRIVWQLRFHRNCDGRHAVKMLLDDPAIQIDLWQLIGRQGVGTRASWSGVCFAVLGVAAELSLLTVWVGPAVLSVAGVTG